MWHRVGVGLDLLEETEILQPRHNAFSRGEAFQAVQLFDKLVRAFRQAAQIILIALQRQIALDVEDADLRQVVATADFEVVEIMRRRDLHRAGTLFRVGIIISDDRNPATDQRQDDVLADQRHIALVVRIHRDGGVTEHGLGARSANDDEGGGIFRIEDLALQRIAQIPQAALDLDLLHFEIGDRGEQFGVPVHKAFVLVDQAFAMQLHKHLDDGARQPLVHREAFARPVAGRAETLQLIDDNAAAFRLPLPHALEKFLAAHLAAARLPALHQLALDHHLSGNAGMVGTGLPQHVAAAHALEAAQHVLQGIVERMAHV